MESDMTMYLKQRFDQTFKLMRKLMSCVNISSHRALYVFYILL